MFDASNHTEKVLVCIRVNGTVGAAVSDPDVCSVQMCKQVSADAQLWHIVAQPPKFLVQAVALLLCHSTVNPNPVG